MSRADSSRIRTLKKAVCWILALIAAFSMTVPGQRFWRGLFAASGFGGGAEAPLAIHMIDVGKADALVIVCEGHVAVLDAGTADEGAAVVDYMVRNQLNTPELVIASHADADHTGGIPAVLTELGAEVFIRSELFSDKYGKIDSIIEETGTALRVVKPGDSITLGGARITVLGPLQDYTETNDSSLVLRLEYDGFTALFCGDIEVNAEEDLLSSGEPLTADLLKVAHHGSKTSSSQRFLEAVSPKYALVSVGKDSNDLPDPEPMQRLEAICPYVFRTDTDGSVIVTVEDGQVTVITEK